MVDGIHLQTSLAEKQLWMEKEDVVLLACILQQGFRSGAEATGTMELEWPRQKSTSFKWSRLVVVFRSIFVSGGERCHARVCAIRSGTVDKWRLLIVRAASCLRSYTGSGRPDLTNQIASIAVKPGAHPQLEQDPLFSGYLIAFHRTLLKKK